MRTHTPNMMADFSVVCVFLSLLLSSCLQPGFCQYQQIDLTLLWTDSCNISSVFSDRQFGTSLGCTGAINANTDTTWRNTDSENPNCVFTKDNNADPARSWFLNLGQAHNIHRITIYPETSYKQYMVQTRVLVDNVLVFTFPTSTSQINSPQYIPVGVQATILQLTHEGDNVKYLTVCEVQVEECVKNKHGTNCTETCSSLCADRGGETTCDSITGNCFDCQIGRWGDQCNENCPAQCNGACDRNNGHCPNCNNHFASPDCTRCQPGWYGDQCNRACNTHCQPDDNQQRPCSRNNGECASGCQPGWHGNQCDSPCSIHCKSDDSQQRPCDRGNAECTLGCESGWYTPTCTTPCEANCVEGCVRNDGVCNSCVPGMYGPSCDLPCSTNCLSEGDGRKTCEQDTGECVIVCGPGYYGSRCQDSCQIGCVNNTCSVNGDCECKAGWSGPRCSDCQTGRWGADCERDCPQQCGGACNRGTGTCESCQGNFAPPNCTECNSRFWGDCSTECGRCKNEETCDTRTGQCRYGCIDGWTGSLCVEQLRSGDSSSDTGAIVGSVVGVGVFIGICILVVGLLLVRSRRFRDSSQPGGQSMNEAPVNGQDTEPAMKFSGGSQSPKERPDQEDGDGADNYAKLRMYQNADDIKPYTALEMTSPSKHVPQAKKGTNSETHVYEIADVQYENTK